MIEQNFFNDIFTLWLSGAAPMYNEREILFEYTYGSIETIEFPTNSPSKAIMRSYYSHNGHIYSVQNYENGTRNGQSIGYWDNGNIWWNYWHENGKRVR